VVVPIIQASSSDPSMVPGETSIFEKIYLPGYLNQEADISPGYSDQKGPTISGEWVDPSPPPRAMETVGLASEGAQLIESGLSTEVVETILQSRAPATRKLYAVR